MYKPWKKRMDMEKGDIQIKKEEVAEKGVHTNNIQAWYSWIEEKLVKRGC